jgi:ATP phosphoribosyltransferase
MCVEPRALTHKHGFTRPQVCELPYSKATSNPARWVLAVPEDSRVQGPEDLAGTIVASELVNTTKKCV